MILGYTRTGHEVLLPTRRSATPGDFVNWTRGDHIDAERILREHGEREQDQRIQSWCKRWTKAHKELRKSARRVSVRGAAEISIKIRGPR
jgi:hypothetical protein